MPQLNPLDWAPQLIWLLITFGILYLLMVHVALPRIGGAIDKRAAHIAGDLDRRGDARLLDLAQERQREVHLRDRHRLARSRRGEPGGERPQARACIRVGPQGEEEARHRRDP